MDIEDAARRLAQQITAPRGAVSVMAWHRREMPEIMVWYDVQYAFAVAKLPHNFEGFRVVVEPRRDFKASKATFYLERQDKRSYKNVMNKLSREARAQILGMMVEGMAIRAISRMTGASKNTIVKLLEDAGEAFADYHDRTVRGVKAKRIQCDEIWSFVYAKKRNVEGAKAAPEGAGDIWTWTALDTDSKLIVSYLVANRDVPSAHAFMQDVADRLANRVQLTTDNLRSYLDAVEEAFGGDIDYAKLVKLYGDAPASPGRYSPPICIGTRKSRQMGDPDPAHVSTSYVERQNLSMRMGMRRFTRLTNGFSKKAENHAHSVAIYFMHYNFVRIHQTLRCSPAMAAGVSTTLWELTDMVKVLEDWEAAQKS